MSEGVAYLTTIKLVFFDDFHFCGMDKQTYVNLLKGINVFDGDTSHYHGIIFEAHLLDDNDTYQVYVRTCTKPHYHHALLELMPRVVMRNIHLHPFRIFLVDDTMPEKVTGKVESCVPIPNPRQRLARQIGLY